MRLNKFKYEIFILIILFFVNFSFIKKKSIGVIGLEHSKNVGNNLLKFAMFIKLSELGYSPYIVGKKYYNNDISFINNTINIRLIKNFSEINENDFDILSCFIFFNKLNLIFLYI